MTDWLQVLVWLALYSVPFWVAVKRKHQVKAIGLLLGVPWLLAKAVAFAVVSGMGSNANKPKATLGSAAYPYEQRMVDLQGQIAALEVLTVVLGIGLLAVWLIALVWSFTDRGAR